MGNHDLDLLRPGVADELNPWVARLIAWCADRLSGADRDYLASFRPSIEVSLGAQDTLLCYHGSPRSSADRILSTTPPEKVDEMLAGQRAAVMAGGHNHVQMLRQHGDMLVVDVGSVGAPLRRMPFEGTPRFLPWAEYAIVHWVDGVLGIDTRRVTIDLDRVKRAATLSDMPGADEWVSCWITSAPRSPTFWR
jgi:hypothetical protein